MYEYEITKYNAYSKSGHFIVGDPGFLLSEEARDKWLEDFNGDDGSLEFNDDATMAVAGTEMDGLFYTDKGIRICTDTGAICIIPIELTDRTKVISDAFEFDATSAQLVVMEKFHIGIVSMDVNVGNTIVLEINILDEEEEEEDDFDE